MIASVTIDFFHDVVLCWCFKISSRLRDLAAEFDLDFGHCTFVLQASRAELTVRWGTPEDARETILGHWPVCRVVSDRSDLVGIDAMRAAPFDYPHRMTAALGCKAVERLCGQSACWDMLDRLQRAHLTYARNVADPEVVIGAAQDFGFEAAAFAKVLDDSSSARAVEAERQRARARSVRYILPLIVRETGARLVYRSRQDLAAQVPPLFALQLERKPSMPLFFKVSACCTVMFRVACLLIFRLK